MDKDGFNSMLKQAQKLINQTLKFSISLVIMLLYINKNTYKKTHIDVFSDALYLPQSVKRRIKTQKYILSY